MKNNVKRVLEWFEKDGNAFLGEEEIRTLDLLKLRKIFNIMDPFPNGKVELPYKENYDPFMINCYIVTEKHAGALQTHIKHKIDLNKYDYFVAALKRET